MNERRRTLLFSKSNIPTENGVYIESVEHEFYLTDDWDTANTANSIAVVTDECKFRMALYDAIVTRMISPPNTLENWENITGTTDATIAKKDYNGAYNSQLLLQVRNDEGYAAWYCHHYVFHDGTTTGYLPSLGEIYVASQNKAAINAALEKCGSSQLHHMLNWSSTFYGFDGEYRYCWVGNFDGEVTYAKLSYYGFVHPFAPLEDSN